MSDLIDEFECFGEVLVKSAPSFVCFGIKTHLLVVTLEVLAEITFFKVVRRLVLTRQETTTKRRVSDDGRSKLLGCLDHAEAVIVELGFDLEGRVLELDGCNVVDL